MANYTETTDWPHTWQSSSGDIPKTARYHLKGHVYSIHIHGVGLKERQFLEGCSAQFKGVVHLQTLAKDYFSGSPRQKRMHGKRACIWQRHSCKMANQKQPIDHTHDNQAVDTFKKTARYHLKFHEVGLKTSEFSVRLQCTVQRLWSICRR